MTVKRFIAAQGLDANSKTITNVATPSATTDAVNKAYADTTVTTSVNGLMLATDKTKLDSIATGATANTGTVTTVSVSSGNGLAGTVTNPGSTPTIALSTTVTGLVKGNGTAFLAATSGTDYSPGTSALATGIVKSTTTTGALTIAVAGTDYVVPATTLSGYGITDAYTKTQTDSLLQGLDPKQSVRVATTAAGTLASSFANGSTVDGIVIATGDRILIKNQAAPAENGIYTVNATGAPTRATDMDVWTEVPGAYVFIEVGTANADLGFVCTSDQGGTLNTTSITFVQFSGAAGTTYTQGTGITISSNTVSITNVGTAGTYKSVTTNSQGQVTAGTNPTTLSGFGITDALSNASANTSIPLTNGSISSATATTTSTSASQIIDTNLIATYRSVRYTIQVTSGTSYQVSDILVIHDGVSTVNVVEYSNINVGTVTTSLASFDASISGANLQLLVTPAQATSTTYKMVKTLVNI